MTSTDTGNTDKTQEDSQCVVCSATAGMVCSGCKTVAYCRYTADCQRIDWARSHRSTCAGKSKPKVPKPPHFKPHIALLLSEYHPDPPFHPSWYPALSHHATSITTASTAEALRILSPSYLGKKPTALVILGDTMFDPEPTSVHLELQGKVKKFVEEGGRAILLGSWLDDFQKFKDFFASIGLKWEVGWYGRTSYGFNTSFNVAQALTPKSRAHLSRTITKPNSSVFDVMGAPRAFVAPVGAASLCYYTKSMCLETGSVKPQHAVYLPTPGSVTSLGRAAVPSNQACVAMAPLGKGFIGYVGDVEMVDETVPIILAMAECDLQAKWLP